MYRLFTIFVVLFALAMVGCGDNSNASSGSLDGTWKSDRPGLEARIAGNSIKIDWTDGGDRAVYWRGTWPTVVDDGAKIKSIADKKAMEWAMLASTADDKEFTYSDGKLKFSLTILGTTREVSLKR